MPEILVTGGTGNLGRELVPQLLTKGYGVRVLSRRERPAVPVGVRAVRGDLTTGEGVDVAVAGADAVIHCASGTGTVRGLTYRSARRTDVEATERMLATVSRAGAEPYLLYISIVGIDRIPLGYYRAKLETERVIEASGLPNTILRTTQWHTLAWELCEGLARLPVIVAPKGIRLQLLDPAEVAERMLSLLHAGPSGRVADMGGPEMMGFPEILRAYLRTIGKRRTVAGVKLPGRTMAALRAGHNCTPEHADGRVGWEEWLTRRVRGEIPAP